MAKSQSNKTSHLTKWTPTSLSREFKMDPKTMRKKLQGLEPYEVKGSGSGNIAYYFLSDVLEHFMSQTGQIDGKLEAAKLNKARRLKVELETKILDGEYCEIIDVTQHWEGMIGNAKTKLLSLPSKLATPISAADGIEEINEILTNAVYEILDEISGSGDPITDREAEATEDIK